MMVVQTVRKLDCSVTLLLVAAALAAMVTYSALGQAATPAPPQTEDTATNLPAFEVASVKPNKSGGGPMSLMFTPDGLSCRNVTLHMLLRETFAVQDNRIIGEPGWARTDRFDIEAKVEASDAPRLKDLKPDQRFQMLLPVLEDRFNLKFHHESREMPTYALVIAKGGPKLKEAKPGDTYPNGFKGPTGATGSGMGGRPGEITAQGVPIASLVDNLALRGMDRTIFDKTGLTGKYDFTLTWTPDDTPPAMAGGGPGCPPGSEGAPPPNSGGPSLFTALEEQLGLKLEPQKSPVDVIVIDHIEEPSPN